MPYMPGPNEHCSSHRVWGRPGAAVPLCHPLQLHLYIRVRSRTRRALFVNEHKENSTRRTVYAMQGYGRGLPLRYYFTALCVCSPQVSPRSTYEINLNSVWSGMSSLQSSLMNAQQVRGEDDWVMGSWVGCMGGGVRGWVSVRGGWGDIHH